MIFIMMIISSTALSAGMAGASYLVSLYDPIIMTRRCVRLYDFVTHDQWLWMAVNDTRTPQGGGVLRVFIISQVI